MTLKAPVEHYRSNAAPQALLAAEHSSAASFAYDIPRAKQASWGQLERALHDKDAAAIEAAGQVFAEILGEPSDHFESRDQAEAAVVLGCLSLYKRRVEEIEPHTDELLSVAVTIDTVREVIGRSGFAGTDAYDFEVELLAELLRHGHLAYPSSPREEGSSDPSYNSDLYLFDIRSKSKVPISAKLGAKQSTRYKGGVRSVSRKYWRYKGIPLIDYLRQCIPEIR